MNYGGISNYETFIRGFIEPENPYNITILSLELDIDDLTYHIKKEALDYGRDKRTFKVVANL